MVNDGTDALPIAATEALDGENENNDDDEDSTTSRSRRRQRVIGKPGTNENSIAISDDCMQMSTRRASAWYKSVRVALRAQGSPNHSTMCVSKAASLPHTSCSNSPTRPCTSSNIEGSDVQSFSQSVYGFSMLLR
jgi:hypothetical protein